jgi:hypothetical protein
MFAASSFETEVVLLGLLMALCLPLLSSCINSGFPSMSGDFFGYLGEETECFLAAASVNLVSVLTTCLSLSSNR